MAATAQTSGGSARAPKPFSYDIQYSLIVAGASLHWMDWYVVMPRMADSLSRRGYMAIVGGRRIDTAPWVDDLKHIIPKYSTNKDFTPYDLLNELERRQLFSVVGRKRTAPRQHCMSINRYVDLFHARQRASRNSAWIRRPQPSSMLRFEGLVTPFAGPESAHIRRSNRHRLGDTRQPAR